ncbi:translocation/assembly module TamB [Psychroflexus sp. CAK1W]|uniref:translocation/assembly module TamB domain-containing protein n=1 Tax=Psychroflexus curvus TaxID=2873595 RepID=UPI001CCA032F|nr:translocation/assembly module TamB domain-containing protein [Psychroflexus curvus]MBZ9628498.1 translocation/assembly module TamB [Psychroflexus curvus]
MVLFVRSPWGQGIIVDEVTDYVSEKVDTKFKIGKLYLTFSGNLTLEELYLEDRSQDTLVYSKYLEANVPFRPLLFGDEIQVDFVKWDGLKANIIRKDSIEGFNFQYIIDAFAVQGESESTTQKNTENTTEISVGSISFTDFDLTYYDEVTGIDSELHLGSLEVDSETIDLQNMKFHLSEVSLSDTSIAFSLTKPAVTSEEEEEVTSPWILVDELSIKGVDINYNSLPDGIASEAYIDDFYFSDLDINLDTQVVALDQLVWKDSRVKLEMESSSASDEKTEKVAESSQGFSWPQWKVNVNAIDFQNQTIEFYQNEKRPRKGEFSAEALFFEEFNFNLNDLIVSKDENLSFNLNDLRFREGSGLVLEEFQMQTRLTSEETTLNDLKLKLNNSLVFADFNLKYATLDDLINSPLTSTLEFDVSRLKVNVKDAYVFSSELKTNDQLRNLAQHNFEGNFKAEGNLEKLRVSKFNLNWGENTQLQLKGDLSQFTDVDNLGFNITNLTAKSNKQDLSEFISEEDLGISLPESVILSGIFRKVGSGFSTKSQLKSSLGNIQLDGYFNSTNAIDYRVNFDIKSLKLGELLQNKELGDLSMQLNSNGKGNSIDELTAELSSKVDSIRWKTYTFSGMEINGNLEDGNGDVRFDYTDENLKFDFVSNIELDSVSPKVDLKFNLEGINTRELGFTSKDIRAKLLANVQFEGNSNQFQLDAQLEDTRVVYDNSSYDLGNFDFSSKVDSTQSTAEITSQFLNGNLQANHNIEGILNALQNHFEKYTKDSVLPNKSARPVNFDADLKFIDFPILSEVFVEGIQDMDTLRASIHFDEENNQLTSSLKLPYLSYNDSEIVGLNLDLNSTGDFAEFKFVLDNIVAEPLDVAKTQLDGEFKDSQLNLNLNAFKDDKDYFSSAVSISFEDEELYRLNVSPDKLILNGSPWIIPEDNEIVYQNDTVKVTNFKFTRNRQEIELTNKLDFENYHLGIIFDNFRLSTITNYLNPDDKLASGKLSGNLVVIEPFSSNGLISNLDIEDLRITEVPLGNLAFKAEASSGDNYKLNLSLKDAGIDLAVNGIYQTNTSETTVDFDIDLRTLEMQTLEKFATDYIKNSNGNLKGDFEVNGPLDELDYKGFLAFDGVQFNLSTLNTLLQFKNERIELTKNKVSFDNFTVADQQDNTLTTSGFIDVEELINPKFDLSFDANNFQLLNSTAEDNDLYYGKLVFDASAKLNGNLDLPKVDLNLSIKEETDLTYIVPESRASIEERDGVVVFVNKDHPDNILTKKDDEELKVVLTGIDLNSTINIQKQSKVAVVFNERTGDNVVVQGGGDFKFSISRTGKMNLVGKYEVTDGSVELNFYNIVKRKFNIAPSSSVTWNGNPYNADLDLRAIYKVETSASSLMAFQTAGENVATQNRYKQQLPFFVYMDVGDELMSPELSFKLDMPEDRQGVASGSVYGRISQVNQEEDQLNKQVFSLLVLNRFYPVSGSDGSQGGPATIARDNINQALSDQLNRFSDKLTGNTGVSLNFDVNSYTDYQGSTAQERTDVDISAQKKLFDDRLVVEAGSQVNVQGDQRPGESQGVVGNVSVEYLLTEDGRWKLRGFRKSEYENVIDGQVFISGIALIFTREFNKFKVLWDSAYRESLKEKEVEVETESKEDSEDKQEPETKTNE